MHIHKYTLRRQISRIYHLLLPSPVVQGTGSACNRDSTNRPTWLTLAWMVPIDETDTLAEHIDHYRGFIRHEVRSLFINIMILTMYSINIYIHINIYMYT